MVLTDIVGSHAQNAAFLWHLRDVAVRSPADNVETLYQLDDRLDAHLDGLRIAGDVGWEICAAELADPGAGEAFTATVIAVDRGDVRAFARVLAHAARSPLLARGIVSALGWTPFFHVKQFLDELLADDAPPELNYLGIAGFAVHRHDPGAALARAVHAADPRLQARALRASGELGRADLLPELRIAIDSDHEVCRFWAAWSAALLGDPAASEALWKFMVEGGAFAMRACGLALSRLDPAIARARVRELAKTGGMLRIALEGSATLGDPALIPWVIDCMAIPEHARFAGWTFTMITGCDLAEQTLDGPPLEGFQAGPSEDPGDPNVALDPDERLPWPDRAAVQAWWATRDASHLPGKRLLLGRPIEPAWLWQVLRGGSQPARTAAAIEVSLLHRKRPLFAVRARGSRQRQAISEMRTID
ncbi:MAG: TIGR02270 family protein [Byssovorax sp.]